MAAVLTHGVNPDLAIVSDDAGQFNILAHALCWIHAERILAKLVGFNDEQRTDLEQVRTVVWELYRDLKTYKTAPTENARAALDKRFVEASAPGAGAGCPLGGGVPKEADAGDAHAKALQAHGPGPAAQAAAPRRRVLVRCGSSRLGGASFVRNRPALPTRRNYVHDSDTWNS